MAFTIGAILSRLIERLACLLFNVQMVMGGSERGV